MDSAVSGPKKILAPSTKACWTSTVGRRFCANNIKFKIASGVNLKLVNEQSSVFALMFSNTMWANVWGG